MLGSNTVWDPSYYSDGFVVFHSNPGAVLQSVQPSPLPNTVKLIVKQ
jgi:hypothetical protein